MEALINIFNILFVNPLTNALVLIYLFLEWINVPYPMGFSIIGLTVLIRIVLWPFTAQQLKLSKGMQDLAPELNKIKQRHKGDQKKIQEETMALYKKNNINPLGGCLPTIVQILMFPALYSVFQTLVKPDSQAVIDQFNSVMYFNYFHLSSLSEPTFFGIPLGLSPSQMFSAAPLVVLIPIVTAFIQFVQSKMMLHSSVEPKKSDKKHEPDFQQTFQKQIVYIIPFSVGFAAWTFPFGLALYWNTFSIFGMIQQYMMMGWGGLSPYIDKFRKNEQKRLS